MRDKQGTGIERTNEKEEKKALGKYYIFGVFVCMLM